MSLLSSSSPASYTIFTQYTFTNTERSVLVIEWRRSLPSCPTLHWLWHWNCPLRLLWLFSHESVTLWIHLLLVLISYWGGFNPASPSQHVVMCDELAAVLRICVLRPMFVHNTLSLWIAVCLCVAASKSRACFSQICLHVLSFLGKAM